MEDQAPQQQVQTALVPVQASDPAIVSQDTEVGKFIAAEVQSQGQSPGDASAVVTFFQDHAVKTEAAKWMLVVSVTLTVAYAAARTQFKNNKLVSSPYWFIPLGIMVLGTSWRYYSTNSRNNELKAVMSSLLAGR